MGLWVHVLYFPPLLWTGHWLGASPLLPAQPKSSSFLCPWASWLVILPCHCIAPSISLLLFYFLVNHGLTGWGSCQSTFYILSNFGLCWPTFLLCQLTFQILTSFGLYWTTFLLCQPISFLGLLEPIYFFFTSFTFHGLFLNPLGFLGPTTTSLPLIIFRFIGL